MHVQGGCYEAVKVVVVKDLWKGMSVGSFPVWAIGQLIWQECFALLWVITVGAFGTHCAGIHIVCLSHY
jgi:hypothetical protein